MKLSLEQPWEAGDLNETVHLARGLVYTFLAAAFAEPHSERFTLLRSPDFKELCLESAVILEEAAIAKDWKDYGLAEASPAKLPIYAVFKHMPSDTERVSAEFGKVFGFTMAKDCPPHAVEYCANENMFYRSQRLADIAGFYRGFGLCRTRNNREREDHLVYLAEFMAFLFAKRDFALKEGHSQENRELIERALRTFFRDHCGWWWPAFARRVGAKSGEKSFYGSLAAFVRHFTAWERHAFGLPLFTECPEPKVPGFEPEGTCFSCSR